MRMLLFLLLLAPQAFGISIGAAPSSADLGTLRPADERVAEYAITSDYGRDIEASLEYAEPKKVVFEEGFPRSFHINLSEVSDEPIGGWVSFPYQSVVLRAEESWYPLNGVNVMANARARFILRVPPDAEPGYHVGAIALHPLLNSESRVTGVSIIGIARPSFVFRVAGKVERSGKIIDVRGGDAITTIFKNTGTVTIEARNSIEAGGLSDTQSRKVRPGEIVEFRFSHGGGIVNVTSRVDWRTGSDSLQKMVVVEQPPEATPTAQTLKSPFNPLLFIGIIVLYAILRFAL